MQVGANDPRFPSRTATRRSGAVVRAVLVAGVVALALGACSGGGGGGAADADGSPGTSAGVGTTTSTVARPAGPAARITEELTGGNGVYIGAAVPADLRGYVEEDYVAEGSAASYAAAGELAADGRWALEPGPSEPYRTRVLVRRPERAEDFSGTVVVEWLNVSGGVDADPEFVTLREEIVRQGHAWVGVSAQSIGVEGGPVLTRVNVPGSEAAGLGLKKVDAERYGSLQHPGDAHSFDLFTQVARSIRSGGPALGDLVPAHVVAAGESQSAFALVTYINGVQPLTEAFDGFYVHSRGASGLAVPAPGESADLASSIGGTKAIFRTDTTVPIFDVQAENDVVGILGSIAVRQPDSDTFRLWEVPGTAHADVHLAGETTAETSNCGVPVNDGPMHVVAKAGFRHFVTWVTGGEAPPMAERLTVTEAAAPEIQRDADGIALGGVRTPPVDVATRVLSGVKGPSNEVICLLFGSTAPMTTERLAELHPSRTDFERRYDEAVDEAVGAGFVLDDDRAAIEGYAHAELVAP